MDPEVPLETPQGEPVEPTTPESQPVEQTPAASESATPTSEQAKPAEAPASDPKPEARPQSRRSAQFRIQELVRENNELKKQVAPKPEVDEWGNPIEPTEDKPDPRYTKLEAEIEALKGLVKPVMTNTQKAADDGELSELFTGKPEERAKYEEPIRKMWDLPQYKDLAAQDLYKIATYDEAIANAKASAIEEYKQAEKQAKESSASGSSNTSNRTQSGPNLANLSDEEVLARNEKVKAGIKP